MVPAPVISTLLPSRFPPRLTACSATESGSAQASSPSGTFDETGMHCRSPITNSSRKAPWTCGKTLALPRKRMLLHRFSRPARQPLHVPQAWEGLMATLSPSLTRVTPGPILATTPDTSCPGIKGSRMTKLPTRPCRK